MYPTTIHWQWKGVFSELRLQLYKTVILIQIHLALSVPFCFLKRREKMENNDDRMWKKKIFAAQTVYMLVWFCCMNSL